MGGGGLEGREDFSYIRQREFLSLGFQVGGKGTAENQDTLKIVLRCGEKGKLW